MKVTTFDGSGEIIWPSSFALARLIAHCPSLVDKILAISKYSESGFRTGQGALIGTMVMTTISVAFGCCCTESMILAFFRLWKIEYYGQVFVD